jgi:membrane protease YdiL (CAAX protease family)
VLAWVVIALAVGFVVVRREEAGPRARERFASVEAEIQGRILVGFAELFPGQREAYFRQAKPTARGGYGRRLRFAVLAGELAGPAQARELLTKLEEDRAQDRVEAPPGPADLAGLLERLYAGYEAGRGPDTLTEGERRQLREELVWLGDLALAPPEGGDPEARAAVAAAARRAAVVALLGVAAFLAALLAGVALLTAAAVLWGMGVLRGGLRTGSPAGGVYAETFAVWMVLYLALSQGVSYLPLGGQRMLLAGLALLASLSALAWPVARGVPWAQVRRDVGWFAPRPGREVVSGLAAYLATVPVFALAVLGMFGLMEAQRRWGGGEPASPGHPIVEFFVRPGWGGRIPVLVLAVAVAPLVEETMFRGALYRHLREATARLPAWAGVGLSALLSGLVFAVIHPQGWLGILPLTALAFGFALAREWRGSLLPPMVAHAVNNGSLALLLMAAMG